MWNHVEGKNGADLKLYALSTCGWCKKTKELLNECGVAYDYVFVDNLKGDEKEKALKEMEEFVDDQSFPLLVVNGKDFVHGYKESEIKKAALG